MKSLKASTKSLLIFLLGTSAYLVLSLLLGSFRGLEFLFFLLITGLLSYQTIRYEHRKAAYLLLQKAQEQPQKERRTPPTASDELRQEIAQENLQGIDEDTGLFNNAAGHIFLNKAAKLASRYSRDFALLYLSGGEDTTEKTRLLGQTIKANLRETDLAFHFDDHEYLIILESCTPQGASFFLKRITGDLPPEERVYSGVTHLDETNHELMYSLLEEAKRKMERAKEGQ